MKNNLVLLGMLLCRVV